MRQISSSYVLNKFYTFAGNPKFRKFDGNYNASCPVCREGKSWLKKKRLYFYPKTNSFYCFNCNRSWNALEWISRVSGLSKEEIFLEDSSSDISRELVLDTVEINKRGQSNLILPYDSVNLEDKQQQKFYQDNIFFKKALEYIQARRLLTAVNRCNKFYISFTDFFHKDRLCIPFLSRDKKIIFYQTRSLSQDNSPRYLNKVGCDKSVFGIERINVEIPYIFLFEGPMDAMFTRNGVALAGLVKTNTQNNQLLEFPLHEKIWILDNPSLDSSSREKTVELLSKKEKVFKWPNNLPFKDFNEYAVMEGKEEITTEFILNNLY